MGNMPIPAIILAAGSSSRLGHPKQLVRMAGESLLERTVRIATLAGVSPVFVVLGANRDSILSSVPLQGASIVFNEHWSTGVASSIHAGLHQAGLTVPACAGALFLTCDQPRVTPAHLQEMIRAFHTAPQPLIVASAYAGALGTPAIFPRSVFSFLFTLQGDRGARSILAHPPCPVVQVELPGGEIDIDEPADLPQLG